MTDHDRTSSPPILFQHDTSAVRPEDRFEYWREVHPSVDMQPLRDRRAATEFHGAVSNLVSPDDTTVVSRTVSGGAVSRFKDSARNNVIIGMLIGGDVRMPGAPDHDRITTGSLYLLDLHGADAFQTHGFDNVFLSIPRPEVETALGEDLTPASGVRLMPVTPLGRILQSHLAAAGHELGRLPKAARAAVIDATRSLARAYLAQVADTEAADAATQADLVRAARRCMTDLLDQPDLTATGLARAIGCSRSTLYRAFESCEAGVMETLAEMRIEKAKSLLALTALSVGETAYACGYTDVSAFARAFRRATGLSPSDFRAARD